MTEILPGLFLGDIDNAQLRDGLDYIKCTHILCVTNTIGPVFPDVTIIISYLLYQDFKYLHFKINDTAQENLTLYLDEGVDFIKSALESKGVILVHW